MNDKEQWNAFFADNMAIIVNEFLHVFGWELEFLYGDKKELIVNPKRKRPANKYERMFIKIFIRSQIKEMNTDLNYLNTV